MDSYVSIAFACAAVALYVGAIVYALIQINKSEELSGLERPVWMLVVIFAPLIGALVWYIAGPHPFGVHLTRRPQ
jgi:Phospholipase_D-nuclease N-terminal